MTVLGIDWGERRVGVSVSDPAGIISMPLCTLEVDDEKDAISQVKRVAGEKEASLIIVGLPINMDGTKGPILEKVEKFMANLAESSGLSVEGWDERMSSMAAERTLVEADVDCRQRKGIRDRLAAQVILQAYLDAKA
jgi:putative Holliday junction resolvase